MFGGILNRIGFLLINYYFFNNNKVNFLYYLKYFINFDDNIMLEKFNWIEIYKRDSRLNIYRKSVEER